MGAAGAWVETRRARGRSGLTTARTGGERHWSRGPPSRAQTRGPGSDAPQPGEPQPGAEGEGTHLDDLLLLLLLRLLAAPGLSLFLGGHRGGGGAGPTATQMATVGASGSSAGAGRPSRRRSARKATRSFAARMWPLRQGGAAVHCGARGETPGSGAARALRLRRARRGRG